MLPTLLAWPVTSTNCVTCHHWHGNLEIAVSPCSACLIWQHAFQVKSRQASPRRASPQVPERYLDFIQAPGSCKAARILARVRIADHALLLAANLVTVPLVGQQTLHGGLAVVQVVQCLKQRGYSQGLCHTTLSLQHNQTAVCTLAVLVSLCRAQSVKGTWYAWALRLPACLQHGQQHEVGAHMLTPTHVMTSHSMSQSGVQAYNR